jgi:hypothetical protein
MRIILKTAAGNWLVSDLFDDASPDWRVRQFPIAGIHWRALDISRMTEGKPVDVPDLSHIREVGFTDLIPGGLSDACSRLDWIEVYGKAVAHGAER